MGFFKVFFSKFYKGSINIELDIYKCPFLKKILKIYFIKKTHIKTFIITRPYKGTNIFHTKRGCKNAFSLIYENNLKKFGTNSFLNK